MTHTILEILFSLSLEQQATIRGWCLLAQYKTETETLACALLMGVAA